MISKALSRVNEDLLRITEYCKKLRKLSTILEKKLSDYPQNTNIQLILNSSEFREFKNQFDQFSPEIANKIGNLKPDPTDHVHSDKITNIQINWANIKADESIFSNPDITNTGLFDDLKKNISKIKLSLCDICNSCLYTTIPIGINEVLSQQRIGEDLNFYTQFLEDDFCSEKESKDFLNWLYSLRIKINGVIDVENGIIYKSSNTFLRQLMSYIMPIVMIGVGAIVVFFLAPSIAQIIPDISSKNVTTFTFLFPYLFIILGGFFHIVIDFIKENQSNKKKSRKGITDWFLWGHVNEVSLITGVIMLWIGFAGLLYIKQYDYVTAFAVGYSIDSVYDTVVNRFEKAVSIKVDAAQKSIQA